jgi:hypothetical protein
MGFGLITIFLAIGGLGFLFLLASLVLGDIFESLGLDFGTGLDAGHDFGVFDSRVIAIFLTAFGGFGAIGATLGLGGGISTVMAVAGGFVFGAVVFYFGKLLYRQQSSSSVGDGDLIGRTAQVSVTIGAGTVGQISCLIGEERVEKIARSRDGSEIKAGTFVFVESVSGDSFVVSTDDGGDPRLFPVNE